MANASQNLRGMLSRKELRSFIRDGKIDTVILAFADHYGRLMGKRCEAEFFITGNKEPSVNACNYLMTVDMEMTPLPGFAYSNWEKGYGDFQLVPDWGTLRIASWLERTALVICDVYDEPTHTMVDIVPRSILREQIKKTDAMKVTAVAGSELEYYLFQDSYQAIAESAYTNMKTAGWYIEDYHILQGTREEVLNADARKHLKNSGIPVESSKGEWGRGQHELNIQYADILAMADRHCLFKQCLKEIADQKKIAVSFMAKYDHEQAGSGCHLHISLWRGGQNAFAGNEPIGPVHASELFRWFLGGWIAHVPEVMVFYAPNVNSYKRYQVGSWAPTRLGWSYDNRTAGFRVVGHDASLRIECRIPGADCNPYLALAASLASGLDGIKNHIEPPELFSGDVYQAKHLPHVPKTLPQAIELFETSEFARNSFGKNIVEHYAHFFHTEVEAFEKAVTDWEKKRYFERI